MSQQVATEPLLTTEEVAAWLQVSRKTVYRWATAEQLNCVRLGDRTVRFEREAVESFIRAGGGLIRSATDSASQLQGEGG